MYFKFCFGMPTGHIRVLWCWWLLSPRTFPTVWPLHWNTWKCTVIDQQLGNIGKSCQGKRLLLPSRLGLHQCSVDCWWLFITFRMRRSRSKMYICHSHLCVCLSLAAFAHYCMDPDVTWGNGRGCPLVCTVGRICNRCAGFVAMTT